MADSRPFGALICYLLFDEIFGLWVPFHNALLLRVSGQIENYFACISNVYTILIDLIFLVHFFKKRTLLSPRK